MAYVEDNVQIITLVKFLYAGACNKILWMGKIVYN